MAFRTGIPESRTQENSFPQTYWFNWKDKESRVLRFLTDPDEVIAIYRHDNVQCVDNKRRPFVCRKEFDAPCELCDQDIKRRELCVGIAVLRQEVLDESGHVRGYTDEIVEDGVDENGKPLRRPVVGIVSQAQNNFWAAIETVYHKVGSLKDMDIEIIRQGGDIHTTYLPLPKPAKPIKNIEARYAPFLPDVEGFLKRIGSEEYYQAKLHGVEETRPTRAAYASASYNPNDEDEYDAPITAPAPLKDLTGETSEFDRMIAKLEGDE